MRKKTLKKLAKENGKVSDWLVTKSVDREEILLEVDRVEEMEIEIEVESNQPSIMVLERRQKRDKQMESWWSRKMCREIVMGLVRDVPGCAVMEMILTRVAQQIRKEDSRRQAEGRLLVARLMSNLVDVIPGVSATNSILEEVLSMTVWRAGVNEVWATLEGDKRMQRLIEWRIDSQRMDERLLLESIEKEERIERAKMLGTAHKLGHLSRVTDMEWSTEEDVMEMDWMEEETREHAFLTVLMEQLELGFEMETRTEDMLEDDCDYNFDDILEHTILDKILQDCDEDIQMEEGVRNGLLESKRPERRLMDDVDECIETIFCEGDCQHNIPDANIASTEEWNRGENELDIDITISSAEQEGRGENISECLQTVHCAGNCADRLHTTTHEIVRWGGVSRQNIPVSKHNNIGSNILPITVKQKLPSEYICSQKTLSHTEGGTQTQNIHTCKANLLPDFETWLGGMLDAKQNMGDGDTQQGGVLGGGHLQGPGQEGGVRAQGGDVVGEGGGGDGVGPAEGCVHGRLDHREGVQSQEGEMEGGKKGGGGQGGGGTVTQMIHNLESSVVKKKVAKFAKPYGKRGVRKDGLIQARIESFESKGGLIITGLCGGVGKRKLPTADSDSPSAKQRKF